MAARQNVDERSTPAAYRRALAPIKAFRTRQRATFEIEEVGQLAAPARVGG